MLAKIKDDGGEKTEVVAPHTGEIEGRRIANTISSSGRDIWV
jgi:hypothetical protein